MSQDDLGYRTTYTWGVSIEYQLTHKHFYQLVLVPPGIDPDQTYFLFR